MRSAGCALANIGRRASEPRDEISPFNHLVGTQQYGGGHLETESLRGLEVEDHLEFRRTLNKNCT
jgi:hypothetical protein